MELRVVVLPAVVRMEAVEKKRAEKERPLRVLAATRRKAPQAVIMKLVWGVFVRRTPFAVISRGTAFVQIS